MVPRNEKGIGKIRVARKPPDTTLVLDIGRTHIKVCLISAQGTLVQRYETSNDSIDAYGTQVFDCEKIWRWFIETLNKVCEQHSPTNIAVTTHGAAAALLNRSGELMMVMDYESEVYETVSEQYNEIRSPFELTGSPCLANGLNLGRQLFWLQHCQPDIFAEIETIIPYPQYWAYRLTGIAAAEVTSLGTHTDLWDTHKNDYSELVDHMHWRQYFPAIRNAWDCLGSPLKAICDETGLSESCRVLCGIHDSNASYAYHLQVGEPLTVISTGTWVIGLCNNTSAPLREENDELLNTNLLSEPLPSFRFMGGEEWRELTENIWETPELSVVDQIIEHEIFALPAFTQQGGPFRHKQGKIVGNVKTEMQHKALASLYCAEVTAWCLSRFSVTGKIIVDGPFIHDQIYLQVLANLQPDCDILISSSTDGTALGAARLACWPEKYPCKSQLITPTAIDGLAHYHQQWLGNV